MNESLISLVDDFLQEHFKKCTKQSSERSLRLLEVIEYSVFSGGKRFRPLVGFRIAEALGCATSRVVPFLAAVELVHTFSLIHDDLPCMDDDDFRRDRPTSHRVFGEAMALLAGDALLSEAFFVLGKHYYNIPEVGLELTKLLAEAVGYKGMIAGQVIDILSASQSAEEFMQLHELKTGALICVVAEGVAAIARTDTKEREALREYGKLIGLAFQIVDDMLDADTETSGLPKLIGLEATKRLLEQTTKNAVAQLELLSEAGLVTDALREMVEWNIHRKK
ncbi:MAG: hypothetical protein A2Z20_00740 [Bdellovibrionales bacterium RBG_16_40_8]|nr:MAG: hypothetical protein A2Z20_00740 [Bdellovibrionales bacterium RBG_16_40_8]